MVTEGTRVDTFNPRAFVSEPVQVWHDSWRGTDRVLRYVGKCVVCGRPTWSADDGENDPRGVMGDNTSSPLVAAEYEMVGDDVPLCAIDANDYNGYQAGLSTAKGRWSYPQED